MPTKNRLTLDIDAALHRKLKVLAAHEGTTMRDLCIRAIQKQVEEGPKYLTAAEAPILAELWDNEADAAAYDDVEL